MTRPDTHEFALPPDVLAAVIFFYTDGEAADQLRRLERDPLWQCLRAVPGEAAFAP